jgi:tetratricopeptide (TPR) repeat protein
MFDGYRARGGVRVLFWCGVIASLSCVTPGMVRATGADAVAVPPADPAPCSAAIVAGDDDKIVGVCGALIDNEKTTRTDRLKALIARAGAFTRKDQADRAIADYDVSLQLDPSRADLFNSRGELWRKKGDRRKALLDFGAALRLKPDHPAAKANYKSLALELERAGAQMALAGKPSFNCASARRPVEKAICANAELADLDREMAAANARLVRAAANPHDAQALQRDQDEFIAGRNASFGKAGYDLKKVMQDRLSRLNAAAN